MRIASVCGLGLFAALLAACANTSVTLTPSPQAPVCDSNGKALVLWMPHWRADQKDVVARETAAESALKRFFSGSDCFASAALRRIHSLSPAAVDAELADAGGPFTSVLTITVRELGPVVKLLSSAALLEGGTEVVLDVRVHSPQSPEPARAFTVQWRHFGPGLVKGVASLPEDMGAALRSGLQSAATR
jgi:hypothetical protein